MLAFDGRIRGAERAEAWSEWVEVDLGPRLVELGCCCDTGAFWSEEDDNTLACWQSAL